MKVIEPNVQIITPIDGNEILKLLEKVARTCYKSEDKITNESAKRMISMLIKNGHEAMLEHFNITVKITTDRGISHEIVRHRMASYAQESTRYCNYNKDKFNNEITVVKPSEINKSDKDVYFCWFNVCRDAENSYLKLVENGVKPEIARSVLPTCLKTELNMTANLREWRHFLKLRTDKAAHPDIRIIAIDLLKQLKKLIPIIFDDIEVEEK